MLLFMVGRSAPSAMNHFALGSTPTSALALASWLHVADPDGFDLTVLGRLVGRATPKVRHLADLRPQRKRDILIEHLFRDIHGPLSSPLEVCASFPLIILTVNRIISLVQLLSA